MRKKQFLFAFLAMILCFTSSAFAQNVAKIGDKEYGTLSEAVTAASAGQTITLLADINEDVTVTKSVTIDGAGNQYTGNISVSGTSTAATVKNVNFVDGSGYAITTNRIKSITVENCTVNNYGYGFLYANKSTPTVTVKNVTVDGGNYGFHWVYGNKATLENVKMTNVTNGLYIQNYADKTINLKNCEISSIGIWERSGSSGKQTFNFEGVNEVSSLSTSEYAVVDAEAQNGNKIGSLTEIVADAKEGDTVKLLSDNEAEITMPEGVNLDKNGFTADGITVVAVKIGETGYETLAKAIAAASAGQTITLLADINENVTINKSLTIDGAGKQYTGTMTGNAGLTVTVQNVNFVNGGFVKNTTSTTGIYTFKDCTFDGAGTYAYPLSFRGANTINVENCTVKNYLYSFLYVRSATLNVNVKDVTVEDCPSYAVYFASGVNSATFENLTVKKSNNGFVINNTAKRAFTIKDCTMENVNTAIDHSNGTSDITCTALGVNDFGGAALSQYAKIVAGAQVGTKVYETLDAAFAAAQDGDEVKVLTAGTYALSTSGKNITITGAVDGVVFDNIGAKNMGSANVTFNNVTFDYYPNVNYTGLQHSGNLVYNNCTINGQVFLYGQSETFNKCTFNQDSADAYNVWTYGAKEVDFNECTFNSVGKSVLVYTESNTATNDVAFTKCELNASAPVDGKAAIEIDTSLSAGATITVDGETTATGFGSGNVSGNSLWNNKKGNATAANNDVTVVVNGETVLAPIPDVAKIGETGYRTLAEAIAAIGAGDVVIELLADATFDYNARDAYGTAETTSVTINGNGKTLTLNQKNSDWASIGLANGKLVLKNMTIEKTGYGDTSGAWNTHAIIFSCPVEMTDVKVNNGIAVQAGATLTNVTINEANGYYGLWVNGNGQAVTVSGGEINATNGGRGIKVADQYIEAPAKVTLSVTGTKFSTAKKAAVLVSSKAGADITASNVNIENVAEDKVNFVWVDEDWAQYFANVTVTGATVTQESMGDFAVTINNSAYFKTLAEAIAAAKAGETVTLLADINENVTLSKSLTIDGAGKKYTGTMTGNAGLTVTVQNVNFVNGGFVKNTSSTTGTYTFKDCTFDGAGTYAYPLSFRGAKTINVENCTVKNYLYSFLYVRSATLNVNVKDVTVEDCPNYAVYFASGVTTATIEKLTVKNSNYGFLINNTANRAFTIKDCTMENVTTAINHANGTNAITCTALGVNDFGGAALSEYAVINAFQSGSLYGDLASMVEKVDAGATVTLLNSFTGAGAVINKNVTIDFNEKTYTFNEGVGSTGTESNGFQILKNNNVTLMNGTLNVAESAKNKFYTIIQNYANLTVKDMNLDGTNLDKWSATDGDSYVLSVNSGNVVIEGETNITANDEGAKAFAFDACTNSSYTAPVVNVNTTGKIDGAIEKKEGATIAITSGTYTVDVTEWCAAGFICKANEDGTYGIVQANFKLNDTYYATYEKALAAAQAGDIITIAAGDYTQDINVNKAITVVGETDAEGNNLVNITGKLNITADGATAKNLNVNNGSSNGGYINAKDVTVEGCQVVGGNGFRSCYTKGHVTFRNSVITGSTYGIHFDGSAGGNIVIDNCTITGWTSFAAAITNVALKDTKFKEGNYNQLRFYQNATLEGCTFNEKMNIDFGKNETTAEFKNCTVENDGKLTDVIYLADIVDMGIDVTVDGEPLLVAATIGETCYLTLAEAVAAAEAGATVTLAADITGAGVVIDKNIIIDFNGKTYTFNQTVGSAGTTTLGFQILKDNNVTLKNGTLTSTATVEGSKEVKMLIQNYANLTLEDMNLVDNTEHILYALSNNCGNTVIKGATNITTDAVALDVYDYTSGGYAVPTVTIETTGKIAGKIEVSENINDNLQITSGTYTADVNEWCAAGYMAQQNTDGDYVVAVDLAYGKEAKIGDVYYAKYVDAIAAAEAGATVELLADITLVGGFEDPTEGLRIEKEITIDGKGHTIDCGNFEKGIRIYNPKNEGDFLVRINNVTIVNNLAKGRCVDTRSGNINLKINNSKLIATNTSSQPLTIGGSEPIHRVTLDATDIDAGKSGYAVISFVATNVDINTANHCNIKGYAAFYLKGDDQTTVLNIGQGTYTATNDFAEVSGVFGAVVLEGSNNKVNFRGTGAVIKAVAPNTASQAAFLIRGGNNTVKITNEKTQVITEGNAYFAMVNAENAETVKIAKEITENGAVVEYVEYKPVAECDGYQFLSLADAIRFAKNDDVVTLVNDIAMTTKDYVTITDNYAVLVAVKEKAITIDLNGKAITVNASAEELANANGTMLMSVFAADTNGNLTLTDSSAEGTGSVKVTANNATVYSVVAQYGAGGKVAINGGSYEADRVSIGGALLYSQHDEVVTVTGGKFALGNIADPAGQNGQPWIFNAKGNNVANFVVTGGTYNADVNHQHWAYEVGIDKTYATRNNGDGTWTVVPAVAYATEAYRSSEREVGYATLAEAVAAAAAEGTVTLVADATGAGVVIDKDVTIDFNGKTYTFNETVGSAGTTTLGFQILKDNNVTLKNGTLTSTATVEGSKEVKMLIQNYANLTLEDMNLVDATDHILYVLSNNCGETELKGNTNITTDAVAFDSYKYGSYAAPTVYVNTTGKIEGAIEKNEGATIAITSGTYTTPILPEWCALYYYPVQNADGTYGVENRYVDEMTIVDGSYDTEFKNEKEQIVGTLTYERTFQYENIWQALFVPFEIPVETLIGKGYEVAYLYDVHNVVMEGEVQPEVESIHFVRIKEGTLRANYPYIIRPTTAADDLKLVIELSDAKLYSTDRSAINSVESSTTTTRYIFTGTYAKANRATLTGNDNIPCLRINPSGIWTKMNASANLIPFRICMYIVNKDGSPIIVSDEAAKSIRIHIVGEENEDGTTTIYDVYENVDSNGMIFDLQGRRVLEPEKGGMYIIDGKKVIY